MLGSVKSESFTMSNFLSCGGDFKYLFMPWRIDSNEVPSSIWFSQVHVKVSKRLVQSQCHSSQINCPDFFPLGTPVGCLHFSYLLSMCCQHLIWGVLFEFLLLLSQRRPPKDHRWHVCYIGWLVSVEKILKKKFPIGSYVKTMSAEGGHLGWRSGSPDTILKIDHLRTIHVMFALNWLTGFRGEDF